MNAWKASTLVLVPLVCGVVAHDAFARASSGRSPPPPAPGYHRMEMALMHLREGRTLLESAEHDHGGWKERAIEHADLAVHETERALEWSDR